MDLVRELLEALLGQAFATRVEQNCRGNHESYGGEVYDFRTMEMRYRTSPGNDWMNKTQNNSQKSYQ